MQRVESKGVAGGATGEVIENKRVILQAGSVGKHGWAGMLTRRVIGRGQDTERVGVAGRGRVERDVHEDSIPCRYSLSRKI
jgi:hypothetical protein